MCKNVTFYILGDEIFDFLVKIAEKLYSTQEKSLFFLSSTDEIQFLDSKLWTHGKLSFIPHGSRYSIADEFINDCIIWISDKIEAKNSPECLVYKSNTIPNDIHHFSKIIDVANEIEIKNKIGIYKNNGFVEFKIWKQKSNSWKELDIPLC